MTDRLPRKLAAVLYADVADYSRLTGEDEDATHRRLSEYLDIVSESIDLHHGQVIHYAGDAVLADFVTVTSALECATAIQSDLSNRNRDLPDERKIQFRIGINLGEVIVDRDDIYGNDVNVAARLESLADVGGICISDSVRTAIGNKLSLAYEFMGEQLVKNIKDPIRAYQVRPHVSEPPREEVPEFQKFTLPEKPSIAVLPFTNMSGDPGQNYFSDGITEDIITELSRFGALFVVARNSSFAFRGNSVDIRKVGQNLGVRFVLEGSVRMEGVRVRITGQLIDAITGDHVWADRYDGDLADVFAVQDEITRSIVSTIVGRIQNFDLDRIKSKTTDNLSAYENTLRGQHLMHNYAERDYAAARQFFEHAIRLDPNFARAHAWMAYVEVSAFNWNMSPGKLDHALRTGEAALALDDHESKSHLAVGVARLFRSEHDKAEYHLGRAAELNPNDDLIMIEKSRYLMYSNEPMEGVTTARQAMRQNPYHPNWYWNILGRCFHTAKHYKEAASALERIRTPQFWNHAYMTVCYSELGQSDKAAKHLNAVLTLKPDFTVAEFATVLPYRDEQVLQDFIAGFQRAGFPS